MDVRLQHLMIKVFLEQYQTILKQSTIYHHIFSSLPISLSILQCIEQFDRYMMLMNSQVTPKSSSNQSIKKPKPILNDQNQYFHHARSTSLRPSPLTLSCSINIAQPNPSAKASLMPTRQPSPRESKQSLISLVEKKEVVGRGGFGKVWRVEVRGTGRSLALKEMSKALVIAKKSVPSVLNEKALLASLQSPFIVNLLQSHQDRQNLYLLLDFLPGGDLRHHISRRKFSQQQAKFIVVCMLLGLRYLHSRGVIHRDIKPQNIVLDKQGYARITDLGVARPLRANNSTDTSGTPGYMAPEVLCRQNHTYSADYFAVGIIAHELMLRRRPFRGRSRKEIREEVLARQPQVRKQDIPEEWSLEAADFINRLLHRKPQQRLGHNTIEEIFRHPWLRNFPLDRAASRNIEPPWRPDPRRVSWDEGDFSSEETEVKELVAQNEIMLRNEEVQQLFHGYEHLRVTHELP